MELTVIPGKSLDGIFKKKIERIKKRSILRNTDLFDLLVSFRFYFRRICSCALDGKLFGLRQEFDGAG